MHSPDSVLENETQKILWDFEIQTDHLILAKRPSLEIINYQKKKKKWTFLIVDFGVLADHRVKLKESEKRDRYLDQAKELKKTVEHQSDCDTNCNWCTRNSHHRTGAGIGGLRNNRMSADHLNYSMVEISQKY